jgi:hypothetical protein
MISRTVGMILPDVITPRLDERGKFAFNSSVLDQGWGDLRR